LSFRLTVKDARGVQDFSPEDFPLEIGAGRNVAILLPHAEAAVVARLGVEGDNVYVQPVAGCAINFDGAPLGDSAWLANGSVIEVEGKEIRCQAADGLFELSVDASSHPTEAVIAPTRFRAPTPEAKAEKAKTGCLKSMMLLLFVGFLLVAAVVGWWLFTSHSVSVEIEPLPDEWSLEGGWFMPKIGDRYLVRSGEYRVQADKEGYHDLSETFTVSAASNEFSFVMKELPGVVRIVAVAPRLDHTVQVAVDGKPVGATPLEIKLERGDHHVVLSGDPYLTQKLSFSVRGKGEKQKLEIPMVPNWIEVSLRSNPAGAQVSVDGKSVGETPLKVELKIGRHQLSVSHKGYKPWTSEVDVKAQTPLNIPEIVLVRADGTLVLSSEPPGANVNVDGQYKGQTPLELTLSPDVAHRLLLQKAGYDAIEQDVRVKSEERKPHAVLLVERLGTVRFVCQPEDAVLFLDGEERGPANQRLRLRTAPTKVEFRREGFEPFTRVITPRLDIELEVVAKLKAMTAPKPEDVKPNVAASGMAKIMPNNFRIGSSRSEQGRRSNESRYRVDMTKPFYIGILEVTNKAFRLFKSAHNSGADSGRGLNGDDQPVVNVTWAEAAA
jgi:hypothetical protein